ncbi:MAG: hypothetical protein ACRC1P_11395 [Cellulosilyticaceae bacterium]
MAKPKKSVAIKKRCISCSSELVESSFYSDKNLLINDTDAGLCKQCSIRTANEGMEGLHLVLQTLNRPFLPEVWDELDGNFEEYMKRITNVKKKYVDGNLICEMTYKDSPSMNIVTDTNAYKNISDEDVVELADIFGDEFEAKILLAMNRDLDNMIIQLGGSRDDFTTMDLYPELIRMKYLERELTKKGDHNSASKVKAERNKMLRDNGLTASAIKEKKQDKDLSELIDVYEDEPIIPDKKFQDCRGILKMMDYLVEQMRRFGGYSKKPILEDYDELKEYFDTNISIKNEIKQLDEDGE